MAWRYKKHEESESAKKTIVMRGKRHDNKRRIRAR